MHTGNEVRNLARSINGDDSEDSSPTNSLGPVREEPYMKRATLQFYGPSLALFSIIPNELSAQTPGLKLGGRAGPYDSLPPNELRFAGVPPTILWRRPPTDKWLEPPGP